MVFVKSEILKSNKTKSFAKQIKNILKNLHLK